MPHTLGPDAAKTFFADLQGFTDGLWDQWNGILIVANVEEASDQA